MNREHSEGFPRSPWEYVSHSAATDHLEDYQSNYSGRFFEALATSAAETPRLIPRDLLAVTALSVSVPASAAHQLLTEETPALDTALKELKDIAIGDSDETTWHETAEKAWDTLVSVTGIGPVTAGKLLAAKLPRLIPIYDQHVADALGCPNTQDYWRRWHVEMTEPKRQSEALRDLRKKVSTVGDLSELRILDILVWMDQWGCRRSDHDHLRNND